MFDIYEDELPAMGLTSFVAFILSSITVLPLTFLFSVFIGADIARTSVLENGVLVVTALFGLIYGICYIICYFYIALHQLLQFEDLSEKRYVFYAMTVWMTIMSPVISCILLLVMTVEEYVREKMPRSTMWNIAIMPVFLWVLMVVMIKSFV